MGDYGERISSHTEDHQVENITQVERERRKKGNHMKVWERAKRRKSTCQAKLVDVVAMQRHGGIWPTTKACYVWSSYKVRNTYEDSGEIKWLWSNCCFDFFILALECWIMECVLLMLISEIHYKGSQISILWTTSSLTYLHLVITVFQVPISLRCLIESQI